MDHNEPNSRKSSFVSTPNGRSIHLKPFDLHKWQPTPTLSREENYIDMVLLLTRNSHCRQGSMGSIIVKHFESSMEYKTNNESGNISNDARKTNEHFEFEFYRSIIGAGINSSLFEDVPSCKVAENRKIEIIPKKNNSDIHAEINAIGSASRYGKSTLNASIYITMPPCRKCFGSIVASGIKRIVTCKPCICENINNAAKRLGIEMVHWDIQKEQKIRIEKMMSFSNTNAKGSTINEELQFERRIEIEERRKRKKEEKKERKEKALLKLREKKQKK